MPSTYIDLCNQTLRRLNEVEIAEADFGSVRGVQALVKDAVKGALAKINQAEFGWPFNAAEQTDTLVVGQTEYVWPQYFKVADWNSFQIQENDTLGASYHTLKLIEQDVWYEDHRDADYTAGVIGRDIPDFVFPAHGNGYGISPSPNKVYTLKYRYFLNYTNISNATDVTRIPETFDTVLIDGALYHMYMFKDNTEAAQVAYMAFEKGVKDLQTLYINNNVSVRDTRVKF